MISGQQRQIHGIVCPQGDDAPRADHQFHGGPKRAMLRFQAEHASLEE